MLKFSEIFFDFMNLAINLSNVMLQRFFFEPDLIISRSQWKS